MNKIANTISKKKKSYDEARDRVVGLGAAEVLEL